MLSWIRRWRPRHLLASWILYWLLLFVVTLGEAALAAWRVARGPDGQGSISLNFGDAGLSLVISEAGKVIWQGASSLTMVALLIAGPPLLIWFAWILSQRKRADVAGAGTARRTI